MSNPQILKAKAFTVSYDGLSRVILCEVSVSQAFNPVVDTHPKLSTFRAIWDTGATNTAITEQVVNTCELKPTGMAIVNTAGGQHKCPTYLINILLPMKFGLHHLKVTQTAKITGADLLIGMDIISLGDFLISNKDDKTVFSFRVPACDCADFVKQANEASALAGQTYRAPPQIGRNNPCPCGSGKKYKHCCGR